MDAKHSTQKYPKRPSHFAHKYCRLLARTCAAQEMGAPSAWLCTIVVHLEDAKRYSSPVAFWNDQLMAILGTKRPDTLRDWRKKAVDAGWLYYKYRGPRRAGLYWVTVPPEYQNLPDGCFDDSDILNTDTVSNTVLNTVSNTELLNTETVSPSTLCPNPNPINSLSRESWDEYGIELGMGRDELDHAWDHYESVGWKVGNKPMRDWRATLRNWHRREGQFRSSNSNGKHRKRNQHRYDQSAVYRGGNVPAKDRHGKNF